ncbi:chorismate mutase [Acidithiobacillus caldus]|uniref:chorismate mutase n=1 Tax=Acidithiobacillus caldus TaxID=33059 RepID=UPI001C06AED8|nr:chorismate mutase [Acidithiobacillus caldus]MBU2791522.1 chorismate mutase [Acidithiobacillus caldus]MBU2822368.1 chorismate mutase [Acidithiobacillus caldus]
MTNNFECNSIEEVRSNIDRIDRQIVTLLAQRGAYVKQAARFKKTAADVKAPQRVEQVISKVMALSIELGANPTVTEQVYRAMIAAFVDAELAEHANLQVNEGDTEGIG